MAFDWGNLLKQYLGGTQNTDSGQVVEHFDEVARNAPSDAVGSGIAEALRSDQTPPFADMIGNLFGNGNSQQQAGMLNQLIAGLGPGLLGSLGGGLGGLIGGNGGNAATITPDQASQLDPAQVRDIAAKAEANDPGIIEKMGNFYAAHPTLVKTLGSAALAIAMNKMAQRSRN